MTGASLGLAVAALGLASFLASSAINALLLSPTRRHAAIDRPGARRMHRVPTPRGGGLGIAVAIVLFGLGPFLPIEPRPLLAILVATLALGWISWRDDRRGVPAIWRLVTHVSAACLVVWALAPRLPGLDPDPEMLPLAIVSMVLVSLITWSINLHNFMDGIDGLLAWQALFIAGFLVTLPAAGMDPVLLVPAVVTASACLGFLPFNFPKARIFMGDIGSTVLGLTLALLLVVAARHGHLPVPAALVLPMLFVTDATLTLVSRMARRRRWYHPHREHLYQWLARRAGSHVPVSVGFLVANLMVVAPIVLLIRANPEQGWAIAVTAYAVSGLAWVGLRRRMLARRGRR
jgi:UDP-N-acetylmuramyl pentapeptide phosphotransferase/UDP-N-acetylglucosamine-1-phosphate transferase